MSSTGVDKGKMAERKLPDPSSPYFLSPSDSPSSGLVTALLTGSNYSTWVRAARRSLRAKNKLGLVDGTLEKPESADPDFEAWDICNNMVVSWIYNSLDKTIQGSVAYIDCARDMWDELKDRYSQGNAQRIHHLKKEISRHEQGNNSVVVYYTKLKQLWDELDDYLDVSQCVCPAGAEQAKMQEVEKLHQFLMGLDAEFYGAVCSQILNVEPLPTVSKAYSIVSREEVRRGAARLDAREDTAAAFVAGSNIDRRSADRPICDYCQKPGHIKATCWQLNGYPTDYHYKNIKEYRQHDLTITSL